MGNGRHFRRPGRGRGLGDLARSQGRDFRRRPLPLPGNPLGFAAIIGGKLFVLAFGVAQILYVAGLGDDPMLLLRKLLG